MFRVSGILRKSIASLTCKSVRNADKIAVINEGQLVELGNHDELMSIENGQYNIDCQRD